MNERKNAGAVVARGVVLVGLACASARAGIVSVGGSVVIASPPADIRLGQWPSDTETRIWSERTVTLTSPLTVDAVNTGTLVNGNADGNVPGVIPAMTTVTTYMLRAEPTSTFSGTYQGFVEFDEPILGAVLRRGSLGDTDALLGRPGVLYNTNQYRGLEGVDGDEVVISPDRRRATFTFTITSWTDDVRFLTSPVPTPASLCVLSLGGLMAGRRRR